METAGSVLSPKLVMVADSKWRLGDGVRDGALNAPLFPKPSKLGGPSVS